MLEKFVKLDDIQVVCECDNWQSAVEKGAEPLLQRGVISPCYVDAIKRHHVEMGPYMVIAPGIVLAHARPEEGANGIGLGIMTLKEPVVFGNETNDPVRLVLTLATPDNTCHMSLLEALMEFLMEGDKVDKLINANTREAAMAAIVQ